MRIVIIGGTGTVGSKLVPLLAEQGHEAVAASRSTGVDTLTGEGLDAALAGADAIVDVSNPPVIAGGDSTEFFAPSTRNILAAAERANVQHLVALSIVGTREMAANPYMLGKIAQLDLIEGSAVPATIVPATQFHEFVTTIVDGSTVDGAVVVPDALIQPIAAADVATALAEFSTTAPRGEIEIGGPEALAFADLVRMNLTARNEDRPVTIVPDGSYFGAPVQERTLVPAGGAWLGATRYADWLANG
jgi:uncharacterized protein YbjT (DUF2867 family)